MNNIRTLFDNTPVKASIDLPPWELPSDARVVIVGGGIAGVSMAYHFAKAGWNDVVVLEQNQLASGTTWHSAGQVGQLRSSSAQTKVNKASTELYARLEKESGHDPGWLRCGGLQLASTAQRMHQLVRSASVADLFGVETQIIGPEECRRYWPMLNTDDLVGGVFLPGDGRVLPGECTIAMAKVAMAKGVKFFEQTSVSQLIYQDKRNGLKRFSGARTSRGDISCEWLVLANNIWMRQSALAAGIDIPVYPCEHHYVVTRPIPGVTRNSPCTRDPDAGLYFRALDDGSMKLGAFKRRSKPWRIGDAAPSDFAFGLLEPDWPDFKEPFDSHQHRLKGIGREDVVKFVNGPEAFTPDNNFILGQPPLTEGLFVAGGWNSAGIACAGGAGQYAVQWIENGGMTIDLSSVDIRRFMPFQNQRNYLQHRVTEVLGLHYQMAWPGRQMETSRNIRSSSLLNVHRDHNACLGEVAGWERPLFFAPAGQAPKLEYSFVRQNWHQWVCDEVNACRGNVALIDQSTFSKFLLSGPDALTLLQRLCPANIDVSLGRAVYTGMLNEAGGYEADLTVVRLEIDQFYIVSATRQQIKDFDWISQQIGSLDATLKDITDDWNVISVMGPQSRQVLRKFAANVFGDGPAKYGTVRRLPFGDGNIIAIRISYVGEDGWELHVDEHCAEELYLELIAVGLEFEMRPIGTYAIDAMRIEKGFRALGHELSACESPLEAGLAWTIDWTKEFLGKAALQKQKESGLSKKLACFVVDEPEVVLWGNEPILWDGQMVGYTTSACFGPSVGSSIAMGYLENPLMKKLSNEILSKSKFTIIHNGLHCSAKASFRSPLDITREES